MKKIKKGDIVARKSHGKDILFFVEDILESDNNKFAILTGVTIRILADAPLNDLEVAPRDMVEHEKLKLNNKLERRIEKYSRKKLSKRFRSKKLVYTGKILHLDGDRKLVIFAGACQSYFEALISAGANFASSPARILIDFADPLIVAENVATTDSHRYLTIDDFAYELRDGKKGIDGIRSKWKKENYTCITIILQKCNITVT